MSLKRRRCGTTKSVAVIGLNSRGAWGFIGIGREAASRVCVSPLLARLDTLPANLVKIVVVHHPLLHPEGEPTTPVAGGAVTALRKLEAHKVRLVLAGHLHRGFARFASPSGGHLMVLQGATATSMRLRGGAKRI